MSMDCMLKADEQPFVSTPVIFKKFLFFARKSLEEREEVTLRLDAELNCLKNSILPARTADKIPNEIDVCDLVSEMFNREMDIGVERNSMASQAILQDENSRRRNAQYKSIALRSLRYDHMDQKVLARKSPYLTDAEDVPECMKVEEPKDEEYVDLTTDEGPELEACYKDLIISVSIYFGYTRELEYHEIRLGRLMKVTDRLELTGADTLLDLKNAFSCSADYAFVEDFSEKKPTVQDFAKNKYPSTMFFIHDTFYIEPQTKPGWEDPSIIIQKWAAKRNYIGPMKVAKMSDTKLADLTCRLGQPYVFIHQGVCEHLVVFNDLSLRDESHNGVEFPRRLVERNFRRIACDICKEASAQWMIDHKTVDHKDFLPNSPGYLCSSCYKEYCFDADGNKVSEFKAAPYCDRKDVGDGGKFISELRFESTKK